MHKVNAKALATAVGRVQTCSAQPMLVYSSWIDIFLTKNNVLVTLKKEFPVPFIPSIF
uniref:Uncharacterized protein n=1 Tax=Oryza brachyantha TaxID=4533 RepID=J3MQC0_ORYBR